MLYCITITIIALLTKAHKGFCHISTAFLRGIDHFPGAKVPETGHFQKSLPGNYLLYYQDKERAARLGGSSHHPCSREVVEYCKGNGLPCNSIVRHSPGKVESNFSHHFPDWCFFIFPGRTGKPCGCFPAAAGRRAAARQTPTARGRGTKPPRGPRSGPRAPARGSRRERPKPGTSPRGRGDPPERARAPTERPGPRARRRREGARAQPSESRRRQARRAPARRSAPRRGDAAHERRRASAPEDGAGRRPQADPAPPAEAQKRRPGEPGGGEQNRGKRPRSGRAATRTGRASRPAASAPATRSRPHASAAKRREPSFWRFYDNAPLLQASNGGRSWAVTPNTRLHGLFRLFRKMFWHELVTEAASSAARLVDLVKPDFDRLEC